MKKSLSDCPPPVFFVSVASKEFSWNVSLLVATLAGRAISVAAKGLKGWGFCKRYEGERASAKAFKCLQVGVDAGHRVRGSGSGGGRWRDSGQREALLSPPG